MSEKRIHITQGQFATGAGHDVVISTLLGSCVSVCLWDEDKGIGGMNHMLLARSSSGSQAHTLSGLQAMEVLINDLLKMGAARDRLQAKAFGGARMVDGLSDIGQDNVEFTEHFLAQERIPLTTSSFGGTHARNVRFWPATGRALQKVTHAQVKLVEVEPPLPTGQGVELF
ncbi:chemotaxis protein CheD [uncultured Tateyamaria sp.]|uniref:chemotaxis protein CheD n=1 Tax=uncultured Tateyamaria sp. TaxID=455651 RepID=UPI00260DE258|nr:chemotaxis protein CheD [uncultured Tateyamaria sp.]